jgi:MFS family permease
MRSVAGDRDRRWRWLPPGATADARWVLLARALRGFGDGFVALLLPAYLVQLGLGPVEVGAVVTGTLLGSAALTLGVGLVANRIGRRRLLLACCLLMAATGAGLALAPGFWPILLVGVVGTINPSGGDVSVFVPVEQTVLAHAVDARGRTALFARYGLAGTLAAALGALAAGLPEALAPAGPQRLAAMAGMFWFYGGLAVLALPLYRRLSPAVEPGPQAPPAPLGPSRGIVYRLTALFSLDAFGGGFFAQSMLALWLFQAHGVTVAAAGQILFWMNVCSALSYLAAAPLAARIGLIETMVFTHLPASLLMILIPFVPWLPGVVALLLLRSLLSQMDVPTRSSYVMAVVTPPERPAAASLTATPRSLAAALGPIAAGGLLALSSFGWPLVAGGALKAAYDLMLLAGFRRIRPPEEIEAARGA